jgi:hypothetical protein
MEVGRNQAHDGRRRRGDVGLDHDGTHHRTILSLAKRIGTKLPSALSLQHWPRSRREKALRDNIELQIENSREQREQLAEELGSQSQKEFEERLDEAINDLQDRAA